MASSFDVWFWDGECFVKVNCKPFTADQITVVLSLSSVPLLVLAEGLDPPEFP
jgi:hypothetical protein